MDRDSRPNSLPDLSERALRAARRAVFLSGCAAVVTAAFITWGELNQALSSRAVAVLLMIWCSFAGVLYAVMLAGTGGAERRGTRIIAVFYAVALWMASAFVAVILSMFAIAVAGDSGLFHP